MSSVSRDREAVPNPSANAGERERCGRFPGGSTVFLLRAKHAHAKLVVSNNLFRYLLAHFDIIQVNGVEQFVNSSMRSILIF
jgi:hypothetical protein